MTAIGTEIERLHRMLTNSDYAHNRIIIERRIFAIEQDIEYAIPFENTDEVLFQLSRGSSSGQR